MTLKIARLMLFLTCFISAVAAGEEYVSQTDFLAKAFPSSDFKANTFWLKTDHKAAAKEMLGHPYQGLRLRYWASLDNGDTAWIINEIGKERPIRIGVVIKEGRIHNVTILAFEESRGWEVRYPFFTEQFEGVKLQEGLKLDASIDGITGATLSVRAVSNVARLALYLHNQVAATSGNSLAKADS